MPRRIAMCFSLFLDLVRVSWQIMRGAWHISKLPQPIVSIFGGSKLPKKTDYFEKVHELSQRFINSGISVLTGGGPGVMEAAHCGAIIVDKNSTKNIGRSIGIGVKDLEKEGPNKCVEQYIELDYFFARKWLLTRYSKVFVVFPGGFGTLDELTEVLTLIVTKRLERVPILLVGIEYWQDLMIWMEKEAVVHKLINKEDLKLITLTNDLDLVFCIAQDSCIKCTTNTNT